MIQSNIPLAPLTTLKVGGSARTYVEVSEMSQLQTLFGSDDAPDSFVVLGGGSNVLIPDQGLEDLVIHNKITGWSEVVDKQGVLLTVGAGENLDAVIEACVEKGYWGLENLSHIPGSVGATPVQNVGAYGVEVSDLIVSVEVFDTNTKQLMVLSNTGCQFGYRDSRFKRVDQKHLIVTRVTFRLSTQPSPVITYRDLCERFEETDTISLKEIREAVIAIRSQKFPDWTSVGTAGSFFKNPIITTDGFAELQTSYPKLPGFRLDNGTVKVSLGWILDKICNLRGYQEGNLSTYKNQALVLIAEAGASATEVEVFAEKISQTVFEKTKIKIEWEVTRLK